MRIEILLFHSFTILKIDEAKHTLITLSTMMFLMTLYSQRYTILQYLMIYAF